MCKKQFPPPAAEGERKNFMSEQINPRNLVIDILLAVNRDGEFSHIAVREVLDKYRYLPHRDRAFIKRVSEGTIERQIEMDYIISQFSDIKIKKMKPVIRAILESGVYQIFYMDAVPDSAVCNEAVKLAVKRGFAGLKGFVNGVLRSIIRNRETIIWPSREQEPLRAASVRYSMPEWIVKLFFGQFGQERSIHILEAFLDKHSTCIRVDINKRSPEEVKRSLEGQGISVFPVEGVPEAFYIDGYDTLDEIPEFEAGILYVQDVSSMMVAKKALEDCSGRHLFVLDVCAAPGGKSIHMAQLLGDSGMVEARDLTEYKTGMIEENRERCGIRNIRTKVWDALLFDASMEEAADIVIADLPCSGLGVAGGKTDLKYKVLPGQIPELAALQRSILSVVRRYVKPGGILMYSTCTVTEEENQNNMAWFLRSFPEFSLEEERQYLPDEGCDGFYIAKLVKSVSDG